MEKSTILASLLLLPILAASGCREKCASYELRYGDKCILKPDSGASPEEDANEPDDGDPDEEGQFDDATVSSPGGSDSGVRDSDQTAATSDSDMDATTVIESGVAEPTDSGTTSANDSGVDHCIGNGCKHSSLCVNAPTRYSCDCTGTGYEGPNCDEDVDECAAALCSSEYPCSNDVGGYVCIGRTAQWPMPDAVPSAKTKPSYMTMSDTVADRVTGLAWQRATPDVYDGCSGDAGILGDTCTLEEAKTYCANLVLQGLADWRLPSKIELESILDHTHREPSIDPTVFGPIPDKAYFAFWSISHLPSNPSVRYDVSFSVGTTRATNTADSAALVRCVRSGSTSGRVPPTRRFQLDHQGGVQDLTTGLTWKQEPEPRKVTYGEAVLACIGGWRLPTVKELLTLVDGMTGFPSLEILPSGNVDYYMWASTPYLHPVPTFEWYVYLSTGESQIRDVAATAAVRCVK